MTRELLLGIDLGTTVLKAAAFDAQSGKALAAKSIRLPIRTAEDGTREQDLTVIDRALAQVASSLAKALGKTWPRVSGVGLAAQGGSAIIVDRCSGHALTPMQLWSDTRPLGLLAEIGGRKTRGYWKQLSFLPEPGAGLARMEWLRRKKPRLFQGGNSIAGRGSTFTSNSPVSGGRTPAMRCRSAATTPGGEV
jgi:sugar (pentulose or hexulose) kinase